MDDDGRYYLNIFSLPQGYLHYPDQFHDFSAVIKKLLADTQGNARHFSKVRWLGERFNTAMGKGEQFKIVIPRFISSKGRKRRVKTVE